MSLWMLGFAEESKAKMARALALAEELQHPFTLAVTAWKPGFLALLALDGPAAERWADKVIAISTEHAFSFWKALGVGLKGAAFSLQGRSDEAIPLLQEAIGLVKATGCEKVLQSYYASLADALWSTQRRDEAWNALAAAFELNDRDQERYLEAELYRRKGEFLVVTSPVEAEAAFQAGIAVAHRQHAKFFELRSAVALARLWSAQDRQMEAREFVKARCDGFGEDPAAADLIEARKFLEV